MVVRKKKFLIGGLIVVLAISYLGYMGFESSATYYYTVSELIAQEATINGENVRVNGQVVPGSVENEPGGLTLKFTIVEQGESLPVVYHGVVPDTFKVGNDVVVEGHFNSDGVFLANTITTKCASKYVPEK